MDPIGLQGRFISDMEVGDDDRPLSGRCRHRSEEMNTFSNTSISSMHLTVQPFQAMFQTRNTICTLSPHFRQALRKMYQPRRGMRLCDPEHISDPASAGNGKERNLWKSGVRDWMSSAER